MDSTSIPQSRLTSEAVLRLVCLPYAGGGPAPFYRRRTELPRSVDLLPLTLPGHDGRLNEPPRTNLMSLAAELAADLQLALDRPYAVLGHSMGGWLAFEVVRALRRRRAPLPELLVVAASRAPHLPLTAPPIHDLPEDQLLHTLDTRYGGLPAAVRASPELLQVLLPPLRADLQMVEAYRYADEPPLDVEILALGGSDDRAVSPAQLEAWRCHTTRTFSLRVMPGGHFFLFRGDDGTGADAATQPATAAAAWRIIGHRLEEAVRAISARPVAHRG